MKTTRLGRVARTISGSGFPPSEQGATSGDLPFVKVSDLALKANSFGVKTAVNWVSREQAVALGARTVPADSIIFPKVGAALLGNARGRTRTALLIDNNMMAVVPTGVDRGFAYWWLRSVDMAQLSEGGTLPFVSDSAVRDLRVPLLPLEVQRRIAEFLDDRVARIDQIIAARRQQAQRRSELFLERARVLTTQGLVVETRASGVPWMPRVGVCFRLWRVGQAFTTGSGTTPRSDKLEYYDGGIPWATTSDLRDRSEVVPPRSVTTRAIADHSALPIYPAGTLLVAMYGATVGRVGVLAVDATVNQACCALMSRGVVHPEYAFHWFVAHRPEIMALASGGGQPNISQDVVRSLRIPAPPWAEHLKIVVALRRLTDDANAASSTIETSTVLLAEYKQALITAAVTGELDVTTAGSGIPG
ncbi:MAG: restriction endonuclease subunit S [Tetrasphaera sp.]|nr:restriction endonuclease subunit S [Tetrasphaera sp.]